MRSKTVDRLLNSTPEDVKIFVDLYAALVVRINQLLREKGLSKKELAEKLGKKPSEISKWLTGEHNFTLRSIAKLQAELGEVLLEVPKGNMQAEFIGRTPRHLRMVVRHQRIETLNESKESFWQQAAENNQLSNVG